MTRSEAETPSGAALDVFRLQAALRTGELTAVELASECLRRASASSFGAWRALTPERALREAQTADRLLAEGTDLGPLHGIPIGIKDNIDMAGETSLAGLDPQLAAAPASRDAAVVNRLNQAGAVLIGRLHMTELAFTALGVSDRGTPVNPRDTSRAPGGSSSGSAVAVAAGEVPLTLGTDTGGSIRIPAAWTGIAGFKPTTSLLDLTGVVPLSRSLDSVGPLARTVAEAELMFGILEPGLAPQPAPRRLLVPETVLLDDLDAEVAADFERALELLSARGFVIERRKLPLLQEIRDAREYGSFAGWEAFSDHGDLLRRGGNLIGVGEAILSYGSRNPADYRRLQDVRTDIRRRFEAESTGWDAILSPTTACLPPELSSLHDNEARERHDARGLRNTQLWNFLGLPTLAVPMGELTSLSITAAAGQDAAVLHLGRLFEADRA